MQQNPRAKGEENVRERASRGHQHHVAPRIMQVAEMHRDRLGPPKNERRSGKHQQRRQDDRAEKIDMAERVKRHPAFVICRIVPQLPRAPAVRRFVERNAQQHRQHKGRNQPIIDVAEHALGLARGIEPGESVQSLPAKRQHLIPRKIHRRGHFISPRGGIRALYWPVPLCPSECLCRRQEAPKPAKNAPAPIR